MTAFKRDHGGDVAGGVTKDRGRVSASRRGAAAGSDSKEDEEQEDEGNILGNSRHGNEDEDEDEDEDENADEDEDEDENKHAESDDTAMHQVIEVKRESTTKPNRQNGTSTTLYSPGGSSDDATLPHRPARADTERGTTVSTALFSPVDKDEEEDDLPRHDARGRIIKPGQRDDMGEDEEDVAEKHSEGDDNGTAENPEELGPLGQLSDAHRDAPRANGSASTRPDAKGKGRKEPSRSVSPMITRRRARRGVVFVDLTLLSDSEDDMAVSTSRDEKDGKRDSIEVEVDVKEEGQSGVDTAQSGASTVMDGKGDQTGDMAVTSTLAPATDSKTAAANDHYPSRTIDQAHPPSLVVNIATTTSAPLERAPLTTPKTNPPQSTSIHRASASGSARLAIEPGDGRPMPPPDKIPLPRSRSKFYTRNSTLIIGQSPSSDTFNRNRSSEKMAESAKRKRVQEFVDRQHPRALGKSMSGKRRFWVDDEESNSDCGMGSDSYSDPDRLQSFRLPSKRRGTDGRQEVKKRRMPSVHQTLNRHLGRTKYAKSVNRKEERFGSEMSRRLVEADRQRREASASAAIHRLLSEGLQVNTSQRTMPSRYELSDDEGEEEEEEDDEADGDSKPFDAGSIRGEASSKVYAELHKQYNVEDFEEDEDEDEKPDPDVPDYDRLDPKDFYEPSEFTFEVAFRRFIILAVMRYHQTPSVTIAKVFRRPYYLIPWTRLTRAVKRAATDCWTLVSKNGWKVRRGWTRELEGRPKAEYTPITHETRCSACERDESRNEMVGVVISGNRYDGETFEEEDTYAQPQDWKLGTTCQRILTNGHQLWHLLYNTFSSFEQTYFPLPSDSEYDTPTSSFRGGRSRTSTPSTKYSTTPTSGTTSSTGSVPRHRGQLDDPDYATICRMTEEKDVNGLVELFGQKMSLGPIRMSRYRVRGLTVKRKVVGDIRDTLGEYLKRNHKAQEALASARSLV